LPAEQAIDLLTLIRGLSCPEAYPHGVESIEVHQTHISVVFLVGAFAYKLKKSVNFGFLDFSTLDRRKHFCEEEVRLNRRLAPQVYLGVLPVTNDGGCLRVGGAGPIVEWVVQMKRLPREATLEHHVLHGTVQPRLLQTLAERLADFHRQADRNDRSTSFARFAIVAQNAAANLVQTEEHIEITVSTSVHQRIRDLTRAHLDRHRALIELRADRNVPCDTHGDLHLDHIYFFPEELPPNDVVMIDCIEFADRFRYADPVADMAFLVMDLKFHGRRDLAKYFAEAYFQAGGDADGRALLPFYSAYRAVVRAKVEGLQLREPEIDPADRAAAQTHARAHWLLALGELDAPSQRPALVLIIGMPGTGKSTLAQALAQQANYELLRSDEVRKKLAGPGDKSMRLEEGIYDSSWTEQTYDEMLRRAEKSVLKGGRVLIDANFRAESQRERFLHAAHCWGIPTVLLHCQAQADIVRARMSARHGDASDADWTIHQQLAESWQPFSLRTSRSTHSLETSGSFEESLFKAVAILQQEELM
jgi:aminoglycoside phosphotransferase family enzyme/predicted kinase